MLVFPLWLPSNSGGWFSISMVTRLVLHRGSDLSTVGIGVATQPQATDSLIPSKTLVPENLTLHVTISLLSESGLDRSCVYVCAYIMCVVCVGVCIVIVVPQSSLHVNLDY